MLDPGELLLTVRAGRRDVAVARLSTPFSPDAAPHLSISDVYVLERARGHGFFRALVRAALVTPWAQQILALGGVIYGLPIHGPWQARVLVQEGFTPATRADRRRWALIDELADAPYPTFIYRNA